MQIDPDLIDDGAGARDPSRLGSSSPGTGRAPDLDILLVVALGGGAGSLARYGVEQVLPPGVDAFPWATFAVNIGGCLALGVLMVLVTEVWAAGRYARPFLGIGVLGGLTTFSTLTLQLRTLSAAGDWLVVPGYLVGTVVGGLLAVWVGMTATRMAAGVDGGAGRSGGR